MQPGIGRPSHGSVGSHTISPHVLVHPFSSFGSIVHRQPFFGNAHIGSLMPAHGSSGFGPHAIVVHRSIPFSMQEQPLHQFVPVPLPDSPFLSCEPLQYGSCSFILHSNAGHGVNAFQPAQTSTLSMQSTLCASGQGFGPSHETVVQAPL